MAPLAEMAGRDGATRGDAAIIQGSGEANGTSAIAVVKAKSGKPMWSIAVGDVLPGGKGAQVFDTEKATIAGDETDFALIVEYYSASCINPITRRQGSGRAAGQFTGMHARADAVVCAVESTGPPKARLLFLQDGKVTVSKKTVGSTFLAKPMAVT